MQELAVPVCRIGRHRFRLSSLPLSETGEHVLRGNGFLTHARRGRLHAHNDTAVIVDEVVVVVPHPGRYPTLGGVGRIGIRGRYLILLMHRLLHRILLFHFPQILPHGVMNLGRFR